MVFQRAAGFLILLTTGYVSLAQQEIKDSLGTSFTRYQLQYPQEKLFVHIDRTFYLSGETIWFKVYDVDPAGKPWNFSQIAYIELLDKDQRPVLQEKIEIKDGKGNGNLQIPLSVRSGPYLFRAYTNWMKNFSPDFYFHQQLSILNTLNDQSEPDSSLPESYDIRFFPEGGNLVNGLSSVIAFKAVDPAGKGVSCQGMIVDQKKDTLAYFQTTRFGMGKFMLTPVKGNTYYALMTIGRLAVRQQLPAAYDQGYVMHLSDVGQHQIKVSVHATAPAATPILYLFVHSRNRVKMVQANYLTNNETSFPLDKDGLGDGISQITVFNGNREPVCERLYAGRPAQQLNIGVSMSHTSASAPASSSPASAPSSTEDLPGSSFAPRSKITIDLSTTDGASHPFPADLSVSAFLIDSLQSLPGENIVNYLLLTSDLKGRIQSPQYYFDETGPESAEALDNLMLTQGWTRFRWEDVLQQKKPYFEFLPEINGTVINAKVIDKRTGLPPPPVIGYLSVPGKHFKLSTALSQADGNLFFHLDNFHGNREIIVQTNSQTDSNCRIEIASPFSDRFAYPAAAGPLFSKKWADQLLYRSIDAQAENAYRPGAKHRLSPTAEDTTAFYGTADWNFNLDDYVRFTTMDEVIREYVDDVHVRFQSGSAYFRIRNALFNIYFDDDPILLIDGVPVFNGDKMLAIDPIKIEKLEVVSHRYYLGPLIADGVLCARSYDGDLAGYQLDPNAVAIQYNGLAQHREYYSPVYDTRAAMESRLPDLRNQLLWSPEITTDTTGKKTISLYTSEVTGTFALIVQGLTRDGLPGYTQLMFTVGKKVD